MSNRHVSRFKIHSGSLVIDSLSMNVLHQQFWVSTPTICQQFFTHIRRNRQNERTNIYQRFNLTDSMKQQQAITLAPWNFICRNSADSTWFNIQCNSDLSSQNITAPSRGVETTGDEHVGLSISDEASWTDTGSPLYHHCVTSWKILQLRIAWAEQQRNPRLLQIRDVALRKLPTASLVWTCDLPVRRCIWWRACRRWSQRCKTGLLWKADDEAADALWVGSGCLE